MKLFKKSRLMTMSVILVLSIIVLTGCGGGQQKNQGEAPEKQEAKLTGNVEIDGSSTVYPITEAIAEEFQGQNPDVKVTVGMSGSGGGFKRFTVGETDISNASRPIKDKEVEQAKDNNIEFTELEVAYDGISIVVNPENDFVTDLTVDELKKIWEPNSTVKTWKDVRPEWPAEEIKLYGPGTDSGTFDYFTEEIIGESKKIRTDFTASEDDNVLVQGISGDKYSLGYFGYAYYVENKDSLKLVSVNGVSPSTDTIKNGEYSPLSRPLFIYVSNNSVKDKEAVKEFARFYIENAKDIVAEVGYVPLTDDEYSKQLEKLNSIK
ncbi:phosphate ABC transporter substrate-binding protein PstS family protein [Brassicibacter mesophilus]|uniref:PstS family phosphate ABC transporter substrate-binding protein n=1 Tax=Brassicibacter mesophilus TaxID=745119 RepID=UPI003D1CF01D